MEDLVIPESAYSASSGFSTRSSALQFRPDDRGASLAASRFANLRTDNTNQPTQQPRLTLLVLRGGRMYLVADYWVDNGNLDYTSGGALHALPLDALDMPMTRQLNAERGVPFVLAAKNH
jgi:hypothetical protein